MERWGPWDWIAYVCLGIAAFAQAANAAVAGAPQLAKLLPFINGTVASYLPLVLFLFGTVILLLRWIGVLRGRKVPGPPETVAGEKTDEKFEWAPQLLIDFALDHVAPTYEAMKVMEQALIARECRNGIIRGFANMGLAADFETSTFMEGYHGILRFSTSPPEPVSKAEMIEYVHKLETGYQAVIMQAQKLSIAAGVIELSTNPEFAPMFEKWRRTQNAMIAAYEPIKRNSDMGKLFRPGRPSRWGQIIGDPGAASPLEIIFDPQNSNRFFWSIETVRDGEGKPTPDSYWEYRARIKNTSDKTVRNVRVTVQAEGAMPTRPEPSHFDINKQATIDLNPGEAHLAVTRRFWNPLRQPGVVIGPGAYGPVRVTVSADDIPAVTKLFEVDLDRTPVLYEIADLGPRPQ
jgi:hypothetical protein